MPRLHDPANVQQLERVAYFEYICWTFAGSCKRGITVCL